MSIKKRILTLTAIVLTLILFSGCAQGASNEISNSENSAPAADSSAASSETSDGTDEAKTVVRLGAIKGPSGLGLLGIMDKNDKNEANNEYGVIVEGAPANLQARLLNEELDIAALPSNLASVIYNKTEKDVSVIAVSTLGVLYLLSSDEAITTLKDVEGKTIYSSGQGSTPEYVLDYLLDKNGLKGMAEVSFKGEHSELAALMSSGSVNLALLPQPFLTTVMQKNENVRIISDLNDEWRAVTGTELAMTCIVVRNEFLESNIGAVEKFLDDYKASVEFVNGNVEEAAKLSEKYDFIPETVAKIAIPKCNIVYIDGDGMKSSVGPLLEVLCGANPQSVGGAVPDDAFYYKRQG